MRVIDVVTATVLEAGEGERAKEASGAAARARTDPWPVLVPPPWARVPSQASTATVPASEAHFESTSNTRTYSYSLPSTAPVPAASTVV